MSRPLTNTLSYDPGKLRPDDYSYDPNVWTLPQEERRFFDFVGLTFRALRLPEHPDTYGLVPRYEIIRDQSGEWAGFEGVMELSALLPENRLLEGPKMTDLDRERSRSRRSVQVYDPAEINYGLDNGERPDLPEEIWRLTF